MKTIMREMVETIKQLFAQKQQMQEPVVANYEVSEIVEQKTLKKKEESEKTGEKTGKSNKWSQSLTLQLKEYLNDNFDFRYNNLTGATEYREKSGKNCFRPIDEREMNGMIVDARLLPLPT